MQVLQNFVVLFLLVTRLTSYNGIKNITEHDPSNNLKNLTVESLYGSWEETGFFWFSEEYFSFPLDSEEENKKELRKKISTPKEVPTIFEITSSEFKYTDLKEDNVYRIENPQYILKTCDFNEWQKYYHVSDFPDIISLGMPEDFPDTKSLGLQDGEPVRQLVVWDKILTDKMDSGEIDWYYTPTYVFIIVDENTLLLTLDYKTLYKVKRVQSLDKSDG